MCLQFEARTWFDPRGQYYSGLMGVDTGVSGGLKDMSETRRWDTVVCLGQSHPPPCFVWDLKVSRVCGQLEASFNKTSPISKHLLDVYSLKLGPSSQVMSVFSNGHCMLCFSLKIISLKPPPPPLPPPPPHSTVRFPACLLLQSLGSHHTEVCVFVCWTQMGCTAFLSTNSTCYYIFLPGDKIQLITVHKKLRYF